MEHIKSFSPDAEQSERLEWQRQLTETAGFAQLTDRQQQMIRVSLYMTQRAFRGVDEVSAQNITEGEFGIQINFPAGVSPYQAAETQPYGISQKTIYDWYCHAAVESLEVGKTDISHERTRMPNINDGHSITSVEDVTAFAELELAQASLPVVLHVVRPDQLLHTVLVLGQTAAGEWLVWEKRGYSLAFRLATLDQVYADYESFNPVWVVRPLLSVGE